MSKQVSNGGDLLVKCLLNEGITKMFGIIGGELTRIYDAVERFGREEGIDTVMVRHEQAGGHMADAWARATGEIGVCLGTAGPGVTHLVPAIAVAQADSIPLLAIGAQIARMFDDTGILQGGLNQMELMKPITKLAISVEEPYEIPFAVQRCVKAALSGRRGPVFLELRETALVREATDKDFKKIIPPERYRPFYRPSGNSEVIKEAVELLKTAEKPIIISGGGTIASEASNELKKLSRTYKIPALTTVNGLGAISIDEKTYAGSYPLSSTFRRAASEADVVLSLGCRWDYTTLYGMAPLWNQNQKIIQVDIDPNEIGKNRPSEIAIIGDVKAVINQLLSDMEKNLPKDMIAKWTQWNDYLQEAREIDKSIIDKILNSDKIPMKPERMIIEILDFVPPDTLISVDGGDIAVFTFGLISNFHRNPRSTYCSIGMGHLGVGSSFAIAAKLAKKDKPVVCINGDGSFMFNVQELETAVRLNLPIIICIANNCAWGMLKTYQKNSMKRRYCDVDLPAIDYSKIAKAFGCYGEKIEKPEDIKPALQRALDSGKPSVLDISIAFESPPAGKFLGTYKQSKGLFGAGY
ncbi:MAG: thiamine pyrophosphate-binding protein [Candidatus Lokiarchaeota archaeon]|nr:thiamine pyrophosphate-binding protein [Candidatus Lokiarchaeota archaeon]